MLKKQLIERINQRLSNAEFILTKTYPLIKDPKMLLGVLENIYYAINDIITCFLEEKYYDLTDDEKYKIFIIKFSKHVEIVKEIKIVWEKRKESPVEFVKNNQLYVCSDDYDIRIISENEMKRFLSNAKLLNEEIKNERSYN
jgi:hypothetical protein